MGQCHKILGDKVRWYKWRAKGLNAKKMSIGYQALDERDRKLIRNIPSKITQGGNDLRGGLAFLKEAGIGQVCVEYLSNSVKGSVHQVSTDNLVH